MNLQDFTTANNHVYTVFSEYRVTGKPETDFAIMEKKVAKFNERQGARVGDFVRFADGSLHQFTHDWDKYGLQTAKAHCGSYFLGDGYVSYSGGLDPTIKRETFRQTEETMLGWVWIFSGDYQRAHNSVKFQIEFRVFEVIK
jgi:hypothetical protein